jgi:methionine-rich copper-binding protein CopC
MMFREATRTARVVIVVVLTLLGTIGLAGTASAHATLIGSDPADGATLQAAPTTVTLTFDDSLENFEPVVTVTGPDGNQYQSGAATIDGATLSSALTPLTAPGAYTIAYRVVSDDGHPVEGQVRFNLAVAAAPATSAAAPPAPSSALSPAGSPSPSVSATTAGGATSSAAEPVTQTGTEPAATANTWSTSSWVMIGAFILIASLASIVVRRRLAAGAHARATDDQGDRRDR